MCCALSGRLHQYAECRVSAPTYDLGKLHGGLRLQGHKSAATANSIQKAPIPALLVLPITQHVGDPSQPIIAIGEQVLKGQLIAAAEGSLSAPVHASSSGTVVAIEPWPVFAIGGETLLSECPGCGSPRVSSFEGFDSETSW